ncbi:MAG: glycosyltransferase family 2 protein [Halobacteriaceae archaeon]
MISDTYATLSESPPQTVLVAIPAYNEAENIVSVVYEAAAHGDVLVVDDGSTDDTAARALAAGASVVRHDGNRGYGAALKTAFREGAARDVDALVVLDADGQHDVADVDRLVGQLADSDADVVVGSRFTGDVDSDIPAYRRLGLWVVNGATNLTLDGATVRDTQSGFRAYAGPVVESLAEADDVCDGMAASTDILYHVVSRGFTVDEVGVVVRYDGDDTSTMNPVVHGVELLANIARRTVQRRVGGRRRTGSNPHVEANRAQR